MSRGQKNQEIFIVKIMNTENFTWQGSVTWADKKKMQNFRSALELMKMLDAAIGDNNGDGFR